MNNEETILDNSMLNNNQSEETKVESNETATSNESAIAEKKRKNATAEKIAYAAGGAVLGAGATFAGQSVAAPKAEKPVVKEEDKNATESADEKAEGKADADNNTAADDKATADDKADATPGKETAATSASQHDEHDGVTVEVNGAKVHVDGDASVKVSQDGTIEVNPDEHEPHYTNIVNDAQHSRPVHDAINHHTHHTPAEEDAILITDDGVKVAHVDDNMSFAQAFAEAREQVGPGGVFVWHGKAYGTFYENEWNHMTPAERSAYQASIDYEDILPDNHHSHSHSHHDYAQHDSHSSHHSHASHDSHASHTSHDSHASHTAHNSNVYEAADDVSEDVEVSILGYGETDINEDGISEYSVAVDIDGQEVLLVDIDDDYQAEVAISDFDGDGSISNNDVIDVTDQNIMLPTEDELDNYMNDANSYTVQNDDLPDYMNDADPGMYMA